MATRSLRHRSSRYSSPATFGEKEPPPPPIETTVSRNGQQSSLDGWIEPSVRPAVPSFEDTKGLERLGVLENMQPLGTAPSQRLLQKLKLTYARPSPRATPLQTEESVTPVAEPERIELALPLEEQEQVHDPEMPSDLLPGESTPADTIVISSPPRGRPSRRDVAEMEQAVNMSPSPVKLAFTPTSQISPKPISIQEHLRQDRLQSYVDRAVQEAHQKKAPDLVAGLRRIRDDAHLMPDLWNVLEAVVSNSPSSAQFRTFKRYIKSGVKRYRRGSQLSESPNLASPMRSNDLTSPDHRDRSPKPSQPPPTSLATRDAPYRRIHLYINSPRIQADRAPEEPSLSPSTKAPAAEGSDSGDLLRPSATTSSPHKRKRSRSASTSSSLSTAMSIGEEFNPMNRSRRTDKGNGQSRSARPRQATGRGAGNRLRSAATATNSASQAAPKHASSEPVASTKAGTGKKLKRPQGEPDLDIEELARRKRRWLDDSFHDYNTIPRPESHEREPPQGLPSRLEALDRVPAPVIHPSRLVNSRASLTSPASTQGLTDNLLSNGTGRKRVYDEVEADDLDAMTPESSTSGPLFVPPPPAAAFAASRGATPRATRPQPATKTRKSARVMVSPNKPKNGGITAGISRAGAGRDGRESGIGNLNGADSGAEDNDEFCASCGGEGKLLCCDGCTNSFHHDCLEPPLDPEEEVEGEWYCPRCVARRSKQAPVTSGLLGMIIRRVDDTIPKAYALPKDIREYFEGVRTGDEGEYEELGLPRTQNNVVKMNRAGFIEEPNYKETRDSKGNLIRCYRCNLTSNGRDIIPCDYCPARWHLDCLDPPLAVPPRRRQGDKPGGSWRCPLHVEHDLMGVSRQAEKAPGDLGRIPRLRKPKNAVALDVAVPRGFRNNGLIEIDFMKELPDPDRTKEVEMQGKIHRIPEIGIRLDFIDRVKKSWYEDQSFPVQMDAPKRIRNRIYRPDGAVLHHPPDESFVKIREPDFFTGANALAITETAKANAALRRRSIKEQQAVLNLAAMSQKGIDGYSGDALAELTNQLISEAPEEVVQAVGQTELDRLLQLQRLITRRLAVLGCSGSDRTSLSIERESYHDRLSRSQNSDEDAFIDPVLQGIPNAAEETNLVNGNSPGGLGEITMATYANVNGQSYGLEDATREYGPTGAREDDAKDHVSGYPTLPSHNTSINGKGFESDNAQVHLGMKSQPPGATKTCVDEPAAVEEDRDANAQGYGKANVLDYGTDAAARGDIPQYVGDQVSLHRDGDDADNEMETTP